MNFADDWLNKSKDKFDLEHVGQIDLDYKYHSSNPFIENVWASSILGDTVAYIPIDAIRSTEIREQVFEKYRSILPDSALSWWMDQNFL